MECDVIGCSNDYVTYIEIAEGVYKDVCIDHIDDNSETLERVNLILWTRENIPL